MSKEEIQLPDDLKKWIETEAEKIFHKKYGAMHSVNPYYSLGFEDAATAMYNLLSSKLAEQENRILKLTELLKQEFLYGLRGFGHDFQREKLWNEFMTRHKELFSSDKNDERSVATEDDSSTDANKQKID